MSLTLIEMVRKLRDVFDEDVLSAFYAKIFPALSCGAQSPIISNRLQVEDSRCSLFNTVPKLVANSIRYPQRSLRC
jgi:hypothetical protein